MRNITTDEAIFTVEPIGTMGYEEGGNYSTFNWLFAELQSDSSFLIYQYCPSNGMAVYRLYDKNRQNPSQIENNENTPQLWCYPNPATDYIYLNRTTNDAAHIYDINGRLVKTSTDTKIDITVLSNGIYILRINELSVKFIKVP